MSTSTPARYDAQSESVLPVVRPDDGCGTRESSLPVKTACFGSILHVDMDAFFASVEQREDPALRNLPVIVGGRPESRGVVCAASYEARRFGVHSAMPLAHAKRLCPHAVFLPARISLYAAVSASIRDIFLSYTPLVEPLSLDEAFLDVTGCERLFGTPLDIAKSIKQRVRGELRLSCSVGIAANKFLAKTASALKKPDGLTIVPHGSEKEFLAPLPLARVWGVGPVLAKKLTDLGFHRIGDMQKISMDRFRKLNLGLSDTRLYELCHGRDGRNVTSWGKTKSHGSEITFQKDVAHPTRLEHILLMQSEDIGRRLRHQAIAAHTIAIKVRFPSFQTITRRKKLPEPTCMDMTIYRTAKALLWKAMPQGTAIRLLGVSAMDLTSGPVRQGKLFDQALDAKTEMLHHTVDHIRTRLGRKVLIRGRLLESPDSIHE